MTNLQLIEKFNIQSSTSAFSCDNVLTDAYDIYCIVSNNIKLVGTTQTNLSMRFLDSSGNAITGANDYGYAVRSTPANTSKGIFLYPTQASVRGFQVLETASRPFDEGTISIYGVR